MSKNSDQRRDEFLGMSYSKASQQLTRKILLRLIQKCGQDHCFVCGEKIETVEELSIEHKKPWLHQSTELFWDLDNIAFSHRRCNRPHVYKGRGQTRSRQAEADVSGPQI
jgi:5-methylcytosine-specific restriction endonuclease McrA